MALLSKEKVDKKKEAERKVQKKSFNSDSASHDILMHWDISDAGFLDITVRGDGGGRVGEVRAGTSSPMPEHKGFMLQ